MKRRHFSLPSACLPPSAFREVGQLTVCSCQDCIERPPLPPSPPPPLPLLQRRVPLPLESGALRIQPFSSTSRRAIRIKRWLAPSAVCWIPQSGREWERRAFKSLRCRAGKAASRRKPDALLTLLICAYYFPGEKKRTYNQEVATRTGARLSDQTWYLLYYYYYYADL